MRQTLVALLIVGSLLSSILAVTPCGKCLGRGEVCSGRNGQCGDNLKCSSSQGNANLCFPIFEDGQTCTSVGEFDACETGFICNRTGTGNCDRLGSNGQINDGCNDDRWCGTGLSCQGGLCKLNTVTGKCTSSNHCPIHQYCDPTNGCVGKAGDGAACSTTPCHPNFYCDFVTNPLEPKCKAPFTVAENENCTQPGIVKLV